MSKKIEITTPLETSPFYLQIGEKYSTTLKYDERLTLTILNPNQAKVSCTIESGAGEVSLFKNGERLLSLEDTYFLSAEPGYPTAVRLNTNITSPDDGKSRKVNYDQEKLAELYDVGKSDITKEFLKRKLARQYGVREEDIAVPKAGEKIIIPDSIWELYLVGSGSETNTFTVELIKED